MPSVIVCVEEDGTVKVAGVEATPEMLQGAQTFASIREATQAIEEAMEDPASEVGEPSQDPNSPSEMAEHAAMRKPKMQGGDGMDALVMGFNRAKKGY